MLLGFAQYGLCFLAACSKNLVQNCVSGDLRLYWIPTRLCISTWTPKVCKMTARCALFSKVWIHYRTYLRGQDRQIIQEVYNRHVTVPQSDQGLRLVVGTSTQGNLRHGTCPCTGHGLVGPSLKTALMYGSPFTSFIPHLSYPQYSG